MITKIVAKVKVKHKTEELKYPAIEKELLPEALAIADLKQEQLRIAEGGEIALTKGEKVQIKRLLGEREEILKHAILDAFLGKSDDPEQVIQWLNLLRVAKPELAMQLLKGIAGKIFSEKREQVNTQSPAPIVINIQQNSIAEQNPGQGTDLIIR